MSTEQQPEKRKVGRKPKLNNDIQQNMVQMLEVGTTFENAAILVGISPATFFRWMEKGESAKSGPYREFREAITRASAKAVFSYESMLHVAATKDYRAAAFFLERRQRKDYGPVQKTEVTGANGGPIKTAVEALDLTKLTEAELENLLNLERQRDELLAKGRGGPPQATA